MWGCGSFLAYGCEAHNGAVTTQPSTVNRRARAIAWSTDQCGASHVTIVTVRARVPSREPGTNGDQRAWAAGNEVLEVAVAKNVDSR